MRKKIYEMIEVDDGSNKMSAVYDVTMMLVIFMSLLPLAFKAETEAFYVIDKVTVTIFIVDYMLRLMTADYKFNDRSLKSFIRYPFTFFAIVDLISILPSVTFFNNSLKLLRLFRLARALRVFRVFKALRYSKNFRIIISVFKNSKEPLIAVCTLSISYILVAALVIFNVEPDSFDNFFEAVYWATISLTTMGYGDIYPITSVGRSVTMISSIFGIAIVALPSSILTAGYLKVVNDEKEKEKEKAAEREMEGKILSVARVKTKDKYQ